MHTTRPKKSLIVTCVQGPQKVFESGGQFLFSLSPSPSGYEALPACHEVTFPWNGEGPGGNMSPLVGLWGAAKQLWWLLYNRIPEWT